MATIQKLEDLEVWVLARDLSKKIYPLTRTGIIATDYRMANQMRGSLGSIMDNIAEGFERCSRLEFAHKLGIARGEAGELKSQLYRCLDNNYLKKEAVDEMLNDIQHIIKKISSFVTYLNATDIQGQQFKDRQ